MRRRKLLINLAVLAGFGLLIWARVLLADSPSETVLFAVFAVIYSVMIGAFVAIYVLNLANPVLARFTPAGWELPRLRTRGSWSEVRAIRVRAMPTRGGYLRGSGARVVALVVDEPDRYLADASPVWRWLAGRLGVRPFDIRDESRVLYNAGAAMASNFLVTLYRAASRLLESAGAPPEALLPLMRRTIDNGFELTGPIARGDWTTVDAHLAAIRQAAPDLEALYRAMAQVTRP